MLPAAELLELYRAEKEALDFPSEPFMSFADWKEEYTAEYRRNHVSVDVQVAMAEADALVEEAEAELFNIDEEETEMNETNVTQTLPDDRGLTTPTVDLEHQAELDAKREARNAKRREQRAAAKTGKPKAKVKAKPKAKAKAPAKARVARKDSKTAQARAIFDRMFGNKERKYVIAAFQEKVGLSAAGASTYYQRFKAGK